METLQTRSLINKHGLHTTEATGKSPSGVFKSLHASLKRFASSIFMLRVFCYVLSSLVWIARGRRPSRLPVTPQRFSDTVTRTRNTKRPGGASATRYKYIIEYEGWRPTPRPSATQPAQSQLLAHYLSFHAQCAPHHRPARNSHVATRTARCWCDYQDQSRDGQTLDHHGERRCTASRCLVCTRSLRSRAAEG
jgi:hypothetical protein